MSNFDLSDPSVDPRAVAAAAAQEIARQTGVEKHDIAFVLGSGWGQAAAEMGTVTASVQAADIPGFTAPAVAGHVPTIQSIRLQSGKQALVLGSRTHYYEGRGVRAVAHGMRVAAATGAEVVVLTNGCGGLNPDWAPGTPVLIRDHINLTMVSPIEGANFVDLTDLYSQRLRDLAQQVAGELPAVGPLDEGVYAQFCGPHYETPAEVRMAGIIGADLVGMSTTLEAIAAREAGLEVLGMSLVTNPAAGISPTPLDHGEVIAAGKDAAPKLAALLAAIANRI